MEQDPVCGMYLIKVDENLKSVYKEQTFYFCCRSCKEKFDSEPEKFLNKHQEKIRKNYHNSIK